MRKNYIWLFKNLTLDDKDLYMVIQKNNVGREGIVYFVEEELYMIVQEFNIEWERFVYFCVQKN